MLALLPFLFVVAASASTAPSEPDLELLVCQAAREHHLTQIRRRQFEYLMDDLVEKPDGSQSTQTRLVRRSQPDGVPVNEQVARDGALELTDREEATDRARARLERLKVDRAELARSVAREEEKVEQRAAELRFEPGSLILRLEGVDQIGAEPCWVVSFRPNPRHRGGSDSFLNKSTGIFFIAMARPAFVRIELDFFKSASVALGPLAAISPGTHLVSELVEVEPGVRLVAFVDMELKLKVLFVATKRERRLTTYRNFKRVLPPWPEFAP